jgi:hypothetical protein
VSFFRKSRILEGQVLDLVATSTHELRYVDSEMIVHEYRVLMQVACSTCSIGG